MTDDSVRSVEPVDMVDGPHAGMGEGIPEKVARDTDHEGGDDEKEALPRQESKRPRIDATLNGGGHQREQGFLHHPIEERQDDQRGG